MIIHEISENTYSKKSTVHYELSILVRMDSFVYMATDDRFKVQLLKAYQLETAGQSPAKQAIEISSLIEKDPDLNHPFRTIRLGLLGSLQTLIPNRLYNPEEKKVYLEQIAPLNDQLEFLSDDLQPMAIKNVYAYPRPLLDLYRKQFTGCRIFHVSSAFLDAYRSLSGLLKGKRVFVQVWPEWVQLCVFEDNALQFINLFSYQHTKDFIYYVMLTFRQLKLNPEEVSVYLSGQIMEDSELFRMLTRYIRDVNWLAAPAYLQLGPALQHLPSHQYYDLFSLVKCG